MKTAILTSASITLLYLCSFAAAESNTYNEYERLESILANPKFKPNPLGHIIPGRFIVEFDENYSGSSLDFVNEVETQFRKSQPTISSRIKMNIAHDYSSSSAIFRGVSISLEGVQSSFELNKRDKESEEDSEDEGIHMQAMQNSVLRTIMQQHKVKHVYPVTEIPRPDPILSTTIDAYGLDGENIVQKSLNINLPKDGPTLPFTHVMTQVDQVHNMYKGKGVLVGIIDSGVDYRHPAFGSGFGPGFTVRYGYDLVGDSFNSRRPHTRVQKETPLDTCKDGNGHGTHVAGIIAANDKIFNFTGVAPEVTLGVWRVFGCDGATSNDLIIKALIDAFEAGCDVINLSLGSSSNWAQDPTAVVTNRISRRGSLVVAAAGNDGSLGAFYVSSPGSGLDTVAIASIDNVYDLQQAASLETGASYSYLLSSSTKLFPSGRVVAYSKGENDNDACNDSIPDDSTEFKGKLVLVQRGTCTFEEKAAVIEKLGGAGIVVYNNQKETGFRPQVLKSELPMSSISQKDGLELKELLKDGMYPDGVSMEFKEELTPQKVETGGKISKFSSVGPLYDMSLKPDFAGPGGHIFSTLPLANGGYGMLSGTSMASPYIAGSYALYLQANGKSHNHVYLKEHFQNYAKPAYQDERVDTPVRQGAGLVQLYDTINQAVHVSPGHLSFNDTTNIQPHTLTISNPSRETVTYIIKHTTSLAVAPFNTTQQGYSPLEPPRYTNTDVHATFHFSAGNITLGPGKSTEISVRVTSITPALKEEVYPIYGGYIQFEPIDQPHLKEISVPYIGIRGSLHQMPIFGEKFPRILTNNKTKLFEKIEKNGDKVLGYVVDRSSVADRYVTSMFRLLAGTAHLKTEVLDASFRRVGLYSEDYYLSRNTMSDFDFIFTQRWNGSVIPAESGNIGELEPLRPGFYYLRWRALKLLSDPLKSDSWESKISPPILVRN